jgi:hypothetical protein
LLNFSVIQTMRMKDFYFCLAFSVALQTLCWADVTKFATANPSNSGLSAADRKALLEASRFHEVHSIKDLPSAVVALCVDDNGKVADPGQNWNATDAVTDPTLPWKRLIWAAVGNDYYVVHYERGGIDHSFHILVGNDYYVVHYERGGIDHSFHILVAKLPKSDAKPTVVWHAVGHRLNDYSAFLDALRSGKLDDRVNYPR